MANDHRGRAHAVKPDLVLIRKEDQGSFPNCHRHVKEKTNLRRPTTKDRRQPTPKGPERVDAERLAEGVDIYAAHTGRVQLFIEVNGSPDDDFFTDPVGLEITNPSVFHPNCDSEDEDREESEQGDDEGKDDEEGYWYHDPSGWNRRYQNDWFEDDGEGKEEGGDAPRTHWFTQGPTLGIDDDRVTAFGQNASYAKELLTRQFRTCVFSLSVSGRFVRFLRWDCEGVTVSEAVDYKSNPDPLAAFLQAFTSTSDSERGWDTSAQPSCDPMDEVLFRSKVTEHVMHQLNMKEGHEDLAEKVSEHYQENTITKLFIASAEHEGEDAQILVSRPCFTSSSSTGRSTRGYWGVRVGETPEESEVVFVKDVWRSNVAGVKLEGDILRSLLEKGVRNIPPLVAHGDVKVDGEPRASYSLSLTKSVVGLVQVTDTDQLVRKRWVVGLTGRECRNLGIGSRVHYRLVTRRAGYPLRTFAGSRELLSGTYGAFQGEIPSVPIYIC